MEKFNLARNLFWNSITYNSDPDGSLIASDSNILLIEYMYNWQLFDELKKKKSKYTYFYLKKWNDHDDFSDDIIELNRFYR